MTPEERPRGGPAGRTPVCLALAGGGVAGALFEFGAVAALEAGLPGWTARGSCRIVGTSAGAVAGAVLAHAIEPREAGLALLGSGRHPLRFRRRDYFGVALGRTTPLFSGAFTNVGVERFLRRAADLAGRADRFDALAAPLVVTATDLDAGERAVFGPEGPGLPPVSLAARASSAIPGTFRPVRIGDREYIDGQLVDPLHLDLAVEAPARAVLAVSALVPYRRTGDGARVSSLRAPAVLDQGGRVSASVKLARSLARLRETHPGVPVWLIEPEPEEVLELLTTGFDRRSLRGAWDLGGRAAVRCLKRHAAAMAAALGPLGIRVEAAAN